MLDEWLFAAPWWLLATAGAAAVALLLYALAKASAAFRRTGLLAVLLIAAWAVAGLLVETPTERAVARTRDLIISYEQDDWNRLRQLIDEDTQFAGMLRGNEIVEAARLTKEAVGEHEFSVSQLQARRDQLGVVVTLRVNAQTTQSVHGFSTGWRFDYRRLGDQWRLERIEIVATETADQSIIMRHLRIPPEAQGRRR